MEVISFLRKKNKINNEDYKEGLLKNVRYFLTYHSLLVIRILLTSISRYLQNCITAENVGNGIIVD